MSKDSLINNSNQDESIENATAEPAVVSNASDSAIPDWAALAADYLKGWKRAQADYANLKKETERQLVSLTKFANMELILELLPTVEYFKQALKAVPVEQRELPWVKGVEHIQTLLWQVLESHGVREIKALGEQFDPVYHEAVMKVSAVDGGSGKVVEELRPGFMLYDRVLQPARVKVAE